MPWACGRRPVSPGTRAGGWPEPFRTKALVGRTVRPHVEELTSEDAAALQAAPVTLQAISDPDEKGMCTRNGQGRTITVRDRNVESTVKSAEKADGSNPGHR